MHTRKLFTIIAGLCLILMMGCNGGGSDNNGTEDTGVDAGEDVVNDGDTTEEDAEDIEEPDTEDTGVEDADACTPRSTCDLDECGSVDDGCGGTIDCDVACNCIDGESQGVSCGECGLGTYQCAGGETGTGTCVSPDLPGLDDESTETECENALVYVDPAASQGGEGTRALPYIDYRDAYDNAAAGQILLLSNEFEYNLTLTVDDGVSHVGGFTSGTWAFDPESPTMVNRSRSFSGPTVALLAENITQPTVVAHFELLTAPGGPSQSTYGVVAVDADGLELRNMTIEPGNGGQGKNGLDGQDGSNGGTGSDGGTSIVAGPTSGGNNGSCPATDGGNGGEGALVPTQISGDPTAGQDAASGASGGSPGVDGTAADKAGGNGEDGAPVTTAAANGDGGVFAASVVDDFWEPTGDGADGEDGDHGHGGGGGGGAWHGPAYCTNASGETIYYVGGKGAGGGAGGCGGLGGRGGEAGGGSFGIFSVRSDLRVTESDVTAGDGGKGGDGGDGGIGGIAGFGGTGTTTGRVFGEDCDPTKSGDSMTYAFASGDGGDGSNGGDGGHGGGGAGGVSYGLYCEDASPTVGQDTTITAGNAGAAGPSLGNSGEAGAAADTFGCP